MVERERKEKGAGSHKRELKDVLTKLSQERSSQETLLSPRLKPQPMVQASPGTGTEKPFQARQTPLNPCQTPLAEHERAPTSSATSEQPPQTDRWQGSGSGIRLGFTALPLLQQGKIGFDQARRTLHQARFLVNALKRGSTTFAFKQAHLLRIGGSTAIDILRNG